MAAWPRRPRLGRPASWLMGLLAALGVAASAWLAWGQQAGRPVPVERLQCPLPDQPTPALHPGMVWVPGGRFELGDVVYPEEGPVIATAVAGFWMARTEVTNDEFGAFVKATGHLTTAERPVDPRRHPGLALEMQRAGAVVFVMPNSPNGRSDPRQWWQYTAGANWRHPGGPGTTVNGRGGFPVVAVTVEDAQAYARWKGHALPSEAQWEWAARAGQAQTQARAPARAGLDAPVQANTWQGLFPVMNSGDDGFVGLAPVGCYAANALGLFDMIGNVWELTADTWRPRHRAGEAAPAAVSASPGTAAAAQQVIKGGSYLCAPNYCMRYRAASRQPQDVDLAASHLGFRTILLAAAP